MPRENGSTLQLSANDVDLIIKALEVYDQHVMLLNSGVFPIAEDDLADLNNDCQYLKGLVKHLEAYKQSRESSAS